MCRWYCHMVSAALSILTLAASEFNIRDFGAAGDGIADDTPALKKAQAALCASGGTLFFPAGSYRVAATGNALELSRCEGVTVRFDPGAVLLMDNLNPDGLGGGHGIVVTAPAADVVLDHVTVAWKTLPSARSHGDAFRFEGFPDHERAIRGVTMLHCRAERAPQAGAVFMGVKDITVKDFTIVDNLADGLHFNACRDIRVDGVTGRNTGDDTLAFVTYWNDTFDGRIGTPFFFPDLGEWSNSNARAVNIDSSGGHANGVRISGAMDVEVGNIQVERKSCGVIIDAGTVDATHGWSYLASRKIRIHDLKAADCDSGFFVWNWAGGDPRFYDFDVTAENLDLRDNANDNLHLWNSGNVTLKHVSTANGRVRLRGFRRLVIDTMRVDNGYIFVGSQLETADDHRDLLDSASLCGNLELRRGRVMFQKARGMQITGMRIADAAEQAVFLQDCEDIAIQGLKLDNYQSAAIPLVLATVKNIRISDFYLQAEDSEFPAVCEIGGSYPECVTSGICLEGVLNAPEPARMAVIQTGAAAPEDYRIELQLQNNGVPGETVVLSDVR